MKRASPRVPVYLGLGGNLGDSASIFREAVRRLSAFLADARLSSLYRTAPRYYENQPPFLNAVVTGYTSLEPLGLLRQTQSVEASLGRDRSKEILKGPRTLDIDILLFGDSVLDLPDLRVPHPGLPERLFALVPLIELSPDLSDPRTGLPFAEIARGLPDQGIYLEERTAL